LLPLAAHRRPASLKLTSVSGWIRTTGAAAAIVIALAASAPADARHRPLPNLRQAWVTTSASTATVGQSLRARDKVTDASARKVRRSVVGFYLSRDGRRSSGDVHLASFRRVKKLRPRKSSRGSTTVTIPASVTPGAYRLLACADPLNHIRERRERDNCAATDGTIDLVAPPATLLAAGDVADCSLSADTATAGLLAARPGTVAMLGDGAYPNGSAADYSGCYEPTWGRVRGRTRPVPGDHDYDASGAAGYFGYFGAAAGQPGQGWYSYELGPWHVVALNSVCGHVGCGPGSTQMRWLADDLAQHPATCTLAYWHNPKYSAGATGGTGAMDTAWSMLQSAGAEVVLNGNNHSYERFAPIDGIREFVVGTGGKSLFDWSSIKANSQVRNNNAFGVLRVTRSAPPSPRPRRAMRAPTACCG
jgi:hypothetical protein